MSQHTALTDASTPSREFRLPARDQLAAVRAERDQLAIGIDALTRQLHASTLENQQLRRPPDGNVRQFRPPPKAGQRPGKIPCGRQAIAALWPGDGSSRAAQ